jgi:hypothetical protein
LNRAIRKLALVCMQSLCGVAAAVADDPLADTAWRLVEFRSMDDAIGTLRPADPGLYTMLLHADGEVTMRLDCNRARGKWSAMPAADGVSGGFEFGPLAATRALCQPRNLDESIVAHSAHIRGYLLRDGRLHLSLMADAGIYVWEPDSDASAGTGVPASSGEGGPRNWRVSGISSRLNLRAEASADAPVLATFAPGTILDNLGCRFAEGRSWCDVQQLGGGPRGFVAAEYLAPAISPDGSVATGPDDSALRAGQGVFDASGQVPCAQYRGQPMGQCDFGVARSGGGYATVVIERPDGSKRAIFFRMGRPIGADTSQADGYPEFSARRESDLNFIRIGAERYEIPDAVVLGG